MPGGGDWSGGPGHVCEICNRWSENVGPRRGFDYENDICGGCCDISSDDDGHNKEYHCRSCKKYMYKTMCAEVDNYCIHCCGFCQVCGKYFHPKYIERCSTPLDTIIWRMIEEDDIADDRLGKDAKFGEDIINLCRECKRVWKRRTEQLQVRPRYRKDGRESLSGYEENTNSRLKASLHISSADDGQNKEEHCQSCKKRMYKTVCMEVDNHYCIYCCGFCQVCGNYFHPKYIERCSTPLDTIVWRMIDEEEDVPEDVLSDDAKFGEDLIELCRECKRIWKQRTKQSQTTRPRKDQGESESDYGEGTSSKLKAAPLTFPRDEQTPCMPKDSGNDLSSSTIPATKRKKEEAATASKKQKVGQE